MTLDQLRIFVAVAERQHVTQAARALNLAQSAVSHAIAALEARHGTPLFDRVGRRIELTEAGRALLTDARAILARVASAEATLAEFADLGRGRLVVQASQTISGYWLPRHLVAFRRAYPAVDISLAVGNTAQVADAILEGAADLGFVEGAVDSDRLIATEIARDQLVVVVAPGHPWADGREPTLDELAAADWIFREPGSGTRSVFEQALSGRGLAPETLRVVLELPSNEAVRAAVEAGLGATALSASVAAPSLEVGLLHLVPVHLPDRAFQVLRQRERPESRAARALLALIGG